jgi:dTDP-4-dehydrorhamnose reductase
MKILVTGKTGQLGQSIYALISSSNQKHNFVFVGRDELDLSQKKSINSFFKIHDFDVVINCAAYTKVDNAENESKISNQINNIGVSELASIAKKQGFKLIHISTDYVFDGKASKSYKENDEPNPINVYGQTKLDGERAIQKILPYDSIIIRTSGLYSVFGENFVKKIINLSKTNAEVKVVNDQFISPTYAPHLAAAIITILNNKKFYIQNQTTQIYHFCSNESISWYKFANTVVNTGKIKIKIKPCKSIEFETLANRPKYSVLNLDKIQNDYNVKIFAVNEGVNSFFKTKSNLNILSI